MDEVGGLFRFYRVIDMDDSYVCWLCMIGYVMQLCHIGLNNCFYMDIGY